jgi:ATP-citrate lyase beta-subunit
MARVKLSEYRAKKLLHSALGYSYSGIPVLLSQPVVEQLKSLDAKKSYVVKVDEGVKKRFKNGLIGLNIKKSEIEKEIVRLQELGYSRFIVEEFLSYDRSAEHYFAVERTRDGYLLYFSDKGGVDVEESSDSIKRVLVPYNGSIDDSLGLSSDFVHAVVQVFDQNHISFLEINPLLIIDGKISLLDVACEVDSAGEFFVDGNWGGDDVVEHGAIEIPEEVQNVRTLAEGSQASLKLDLLNADGSIFLLLSGGGASIVVADEIYNLGYGKEIANYGEYSGNPNDEETYTYTKNVLSLLLKSKSPKKVLVIAGGVANFTDIRKTFKGIIRALGEESEQLRKQKIRVFVRRGGPYQKEGLAAMKLFLEKEELYGEVAGPELVLTEIIQKTLKHI